MTDTLKMFLLIGQSNMAGRGRIDEVSKLVHPDVSMFRAGRWIPAEEPIHTDKPEIAGIGLGMSFAVSLIREAGMAPVGLIPCAVGGTPLDRWIAGSDLYEEAIATTRAAVGGGTLSGILWHQGEGDSGTRDDAASYAERFRNMVQSLRSDLSAESVPVIAGELGPFLQHHEGCDFFKLVNTQLKELEINLPGYACVSAEGMKDNGDSLHFNASSLRELGVRYAARFIDITSR